MTPAERLRKHQRALEKTQRELDRERTKLEQQEKKLVAEIKVAYIRHEASTSAKDLCRKAPRMDRWDRSRCRQRIWCGQGGTNRCIYYRRALLELGPLTQSRLKVHTEVLPDAHTITGHILANTSTHIHHALDRSKANQFRPSEVTSK